MKENKIWNDYLPEDMQEHWTVYECLKESEDSSTFLVKETATGILCVLKWGRNRQAEFLRNEMEIMKKMADRKLSGIPKAYRIFEENGEVYLVREIYRGNVSGSDGSAKRWHIRSGNLQDQQEDMPDSRAVSESG